jgi:hypothetical protein
MAEAATRQCRCGHGYSVHLIDYGSSTGQDGCYGTEQMPKGKRPNWEERQCDCTGYRPRQNIRPLRGSKGGFTCPNRTAFATSSPASVPTNCHRRNHDDTPKPGPPEPC